MNGKQEALVPRQRRPCDALMPAPRPRLLQDFASVLRGSGCGAVLPILSGLPSSAMLTDVSKRLHGAGLPCVGLPPGDGSNGGASDSVALLASDKWR